MGINVEEVKYRSRWKAVVDMTKSQLGNKWHVSKQVSNIQKKASVTKLLLKIVSLQFLFLNTCRATIFMVVQFELLWHP